MPSPSLGCEEGDMALPWGSKEGEGLEEGRAIAIPYLYSHGVWGGGVKERRDNAPPWGSDEVETTLPY